VFIFGVNNYLKTKEYPLLIKVFHVLITFIVFQFYFIDFRIILWDLFRDGIDAFYNNTHIIFSIELDILISIIYFITCVFLSGLSLGIGMKAKGRKLFLKLSPFFVLITSIRGYGKYLLEYETKKSMIDFLIIVLIFSLVFGLINFFYNKPGKSIFTE
jgi:hypothetical protein